MVVQSSVQIVGTQRNSLDDVGTPQEVHSLSVCVCESQWVSERERVAILAQVDPPLPSGGARGRPGEFAVGSSILAGWTILRAGEGLSPRPPHLPSSGPALCFSSASPPYVLTGKFELLRDFQLRVLEGDLGEFGPPCEPLLSRTFRTFTTTSPSA